MSDDRPCSHVSALLEVTPAPNTPDGCEECLETNGTWRHLRLCVDCGHVGCCDHSPNQHATGHFKATGHSVIRSFEPGEDWWWCYVDEAGWELPDTPPAPSHA